MAMGLSRPDNSRARPSSLLKRDEDYKRIFSTATSLEVYLWLAQSQKTVDRRCDSAGADQPPLPPVHDRGRPPRRWAGTESCST